MNWKFHARASGVFFGYASAVGFAGLALGIMVSSFIESLSGSQISRDTNDWLQAAATLIGAAVGVLGAFAVGRWNIETVQRLQRQNDRQIAKDLTRDFSEIGPRDLIVLRRAIDIINGGADRSIRGWMAAFADLPGQSDVRDTAVLRASPKIFAAMVRLREFRSYARLYGVNSLADPRIEHWTSADHLLVVSNAWFNMLDAAIAEFGSSDLLSNARAEFKDCFERLIPYSAVAEAEIAFARGGLDRAPLPQQLG